MSAPEIVRIVRIAEIAVVGEVVRVAEVVVVVVGVVGAVEVAAVVTAGGTGAMAGTGAAEGIKPRIEIYKSENLHPVAQSATRVGASDEGSCELVAALFFWEEFAQVSRKCSRLFRGAQERISFVLRRSM